MMKYCAFLSIMILLIGVNSERSKQNPPDRHPKKTCCTSTAIQSFITAAKQPPVNVSDRKCRDFGVEAESYPTANCPGDSSVLVTLYDSTHGANWINNTNWLEPGRPIGSWYGITTNANGCVTKIDLYRNRVVGILPPALGNLTELDTFIFSTLKFRDSTNILTGPIPKELGSLLKLKHLSIGENELEGPIPAELGQLVNLEEIYLHANRLKGPIPDTWDTLVKLKKLYLGWNELMTLPPWLGKLTNLTDLVLDYAMLNDSIPKELGALQNMHILNLEHNSLHGAIPPGLSQLTKLRDLRLNNNKLTGTIPVQLAGLDSLITLWLDHNWLSEPIPAVLKNLKSLNILLLQNNRYTFEDLLPAIDFIKKDTWFCIYLDQDSIYTDTLIQAQLCGTLTVDLGIDDTVSTNVYAWFKNGMPYDTIQGNNALVLTNLQLADSGVYHCEITNPLLPQLTLHSRPIRIAIADHTPPVWTYCPGNQTVYTGVSTCYAVTNWLNPIAIDDCSAGLTIQQIAGPAGDSVPVAGSPHTVIYQATDGSGNTKTCTFTVTAKDNTLPVFLCPGDKILNNIPGTCGAVLLWNPDVSDNCGPVTLTKTSPGPGIGDTFPAVSHWDTVSYRAMDIGGNTSTCSFRVIVIDKEAPELVCPKNLTLLTDSLGCQGVGNWATPTEATDNCPGALKIEQLGGPNPGSLFSLDSSPYQLKYRVTDVAGNTGNCSFTITVKDGFPPKAGCRDTSVALDAAGVASLSLAALEHGSTDLCSPVFPLDSTVTFDCTQLGQHILTLVVSDTAYNTSTCTATVTVLDTIAPLIACPVAATISNEPDQCSGVVVWPLPVTQDNCTINPVITQIDGPDLGTAVPVAAAPYTIVLQSTDDSGNSAICSFSVTVWDTQAPLAVCWDIMIKLDTQGEAMIVAEDVDGGSKDNCSAVILSAAPTNFDCNSPLLNPVTLWVEDFSGNVSSCIAQVTIDDGFPYPGLNVADDFFYQPGEGDYVSDLSSNDSFPAKRTLRLIRDNFPDDLNLDSVGLDSVSYSLPAEFSDTLTFRYVLCALVSGCEKNCDTATVFILPRFRPDAICDIPSGIVGNDQNGNDSWVIPELLRNNYPDHEITVVNRWGSVVFSTKNYKNDWKGTFQNTTSLLTPGDYFYSIRFDRGKHCEGALTILEH